MRIALLSDIHGNSLALDAVLVDIEAQGGVDAYWVLGDLVALGHDPVGVLERLAALPNARWIRGNTDRYVVTGERPPPSPAEVVADPWLLPVLVEVAGTFAWMQGVVTATGWFDWLRALPLEQRGELPDGTPTLVVHAAPGCDDGQGIPPDLGDRELAAQLSGCGADLVCVGHTHRPFDRSVAGRRIVNPGSVSNALAPDLRAGYALLEADETGYTVQHRRADYDRQAVIDAVRRLHHPGAEFIIGHMRGRYSGKLGYRMRCAMNGMLSLARQAGRRVLGRAVAGEVRPARRRRCVALALSLLIAGCTAPRPTVTPGTALPATPTLVPTAPPATVPPGAHPLSARRFGMMALDSRNGSGVHGTFTARDNGDGTTYLRVQLDGGGEVNPWGIFALGSCDDMVPENQRAIFDMPDIEGGHKEEAVETEAYARHPGNLVVVVYSMTDPAHVAACANLGLPIELALAGAAPAPSSTPDCSGATVGSAEVPGEGHWLAYSATQNNNTDIYIIRVDAHGADRATIRRLTTHPAADFDPTWSPDGRRIAFRSQRDGNDEIYLMNADGSCQTNLTHDPASDWSPAWSPDGTRIAFARFFDKPYTDVAVMNADGSGLTRLTTAQGEYPAWSPDGRRIAFASARDGNYEIYVMNADGSGQTRLTDNPAYDMSPAWSSDGTQIVFDTQRDHWPPKEIGIGPEFEIHVLNADGSGDTQMTNNLQEDRFPAWGPDGRIAWSRDGALFMMNADGSNAVQLLDNGRFPAWRPAR